MLRRLATLLLAIACACAPVVAALTPVADATDDCCCGTKCPCPPANRPAPTTAGANLAPAATASIERRTAVRKPSSRQARAAFAAFLSDSEDSAAPAAFAAANERAATAASVALFQAHCSLLL